MFDHPLGPVVLDIAGKELLQDEAEILQHPQVGGVIFFRRNFESPEQLAYLVQCIRSKRPNLMLAVDQEGGRVQRFKDGFTRLPPLRSIGDLHEKVPADGVIAARELAWLMAAEVRACGVDISFAPVVDADDAFSSVIGDRAFSRDLVRVATLGKAYMDGMSDAGMPATLKHFPGHGSVEEDSHEELPVDERTFDDVWQGDMAPFRELLPFAGAVMPGHLLFSSIDPSPVGFSSFWLQKVLRQQLNFSGVIFSDDLSMEGAAVIGDHRDRAEAALSAGCDAVLVCNQPKRAVEVIERLNGIGHLANNRLMQMRARGVPPAESLDSLCKTSRWQAACRRAGELLNSIN
jgi:beta-N-acetylhexosaminidase